MALAASRRVARAKCVQASDGSISLLLVPKAERENGDARAVPSRDLIDRVAGFFDGGAHEVMRPTKQRHAPC